MSHRLGTYIFNVLFVVLGLAFFHSASRFPSDAFIGPGYFPSILSALLVLLSLLSAFQAHVRQDKKIELPKYSSILFITGSAVGLLLLWIFSGSFYLSSFLSTSFLICYFDPTPRSPKKPVKALALAGAIVLFVYGVFGLLLGFRF